MQNCRGAHARAFGAAKGPLLRRAAEESGAIFRGLCTSPSPASSGTVSTTIWLHPESVKGGVKEGELKYDSMLSGGSHQNFIKHGLVIRRLSHMVELN
jgi:hypothetical protein